ncbi:MAG: ACP S-malonyltransferase [Candidatus Aminicenantes bacterium]|nr:ACP S-malonyltransferase [Candidatus Aminicenantes bacterium]
MSKIAFLFPGQGSQSVGMGLDFYGHSSQAREIFAQADEILGFNLSRLCFEGPEEELKLTEITQPALLTVSFIAHTLLGIEPRIAAGHSLGEYSALVAAGSLSFEDALPLVHKRGKYMQEAVPVGVGAMAAILGASYEEVKEGISKVKEGIVDIANWNSQQQIVISGHKEAVQEALKVIDPPRSVVLPVSAPFHSRLMKTAEEKLVQDLDQTEFRALEFPIVTNVNAEIIHQGSQAREALKRQVSRPVLWYESMERLKAENIDLFLELGSGKVLSGLVKRIGRRWSFPLTTLNVENSETLKESREILSGILGGKKESKL